MNKNVNDFAAGILSKLKPGNPVAVCRQCGRVLTDPASVKAGIGPECAVKEANGESPEG